MVYVYASRGSQLGYRSSEKLLKPGTSLGWQGCALPGGPFDEDVRIAPDYTRGIGVFLEDGNLVRDGARPELCNSKTEVEDRWEGER